MAAIAEAVAGLAGGLITGGMQSYLNWQQAQNQERWNQINFDYQKAVQQQIFEREDNAVQRRMADLKAAGLNPNLAAGSAAGAGSVVGRANTGVKDINIGNPVGTALDMATHVAQLRAQREQNQILENQVRESKANAHLAEKEDQLNDIEFANLLGFTPHLKYKNGKFNVYMEDETKQWTYDSDNKEFNSDPITEANSRLMKYLNWQYVNNQNSAALLQKDVDWYTADKIANYAGTAANIFSGFGSGYRNFNYTNKRR